MTEISLKRLPGRPDDVVLRVFSENPEMLTVIGLKGLPHGDVFGFDAVNREKMRAWLFGQDVAAKLAPLPGNMQSFADAARVVIENTWDHDADTVSLPRVDFMAFVEAFSTATRLPPALTGLASMFAHALDYATLGELYEARAALAKIATDMSKPATLRGIAKRIRNAIETK